MKNTFLFRIAARLPFLILTLFPAAVFAQNTLDLAGLSSSSPATVAYSLRRLSSSYSGNLIQVRRSSDNTTSDIGYDGSGNLDQAALLAFVGTGGSDNGFIVKWYDQSGNANDAVQSTTSSQPQIVSAGAVLMSHSRPVIFFNGSTFIDGGTTSYGITGAHTLSAVYNFQSGTVTNILDRTASNLALTSIDGNNKAQFRSDANWTGFGGTTQTPPFSNTATLEWDGSNNVNMYKNGTVDYSSSVPLPATLDIMRIGRHFSVTGSATLNFWEVILFPSAISSADRGSMECNQETYYNLVPPGISSNVTICSGSSTSLSASGSTSYTWSPATGLSATTGAGVTASPTVTTTYTVTGTTGSCSGTSSVTVSVNALPDISNFTSPSATSPCAGSGSTVTVNSTSLGSGTFTATYDLSGSNTVTGHTATLTMGASSGTFTIPSSDLGATGSTTVTITQITNSSSCNTTVSSSNTAAFNVNAYPTVAAITGNTTLSTAITTTLADVTGGGTWSSVSTGVATINSSGVVSGVSAGSSLISYAVTTSGCTTAATTNVTVNTPTNGLNFDGSNDYLSTSSPSSIPSANSQYTIEAWIKPTSGGSEGIAGWGSYGTTNAVTAFRLGSSTQLVNYWWGNDLIVTVPNLVDGNWHHVACTFDGTTRAIYVDGTQYGTDAPVGHNVTTTSNLTVGVTNTSEYFPGSIDEVRIWNIGLTQTQIQTDMNCDVPQSSNLVAYYRFDQGTAGGTNTGLTCVLDYSGNNNSGTLNNFALTGSTSNYVTGAIGDCNAITLPTPGSFSGNSPVCVASTITLSNASTGGIWSTASGAIALNSTSGLVTGVSAATPTVNYTLNCTASSVTVTVNALPTPSFTSSAAANICAGTSVTYTTQSGQSSYVWSVPGTGGGVDYTITSGGISSTDNTVTLTWITSGSKTVTVNYTNANGCTGASAASSATSVHALPTPSFTAQPGASACASTNVTYTTQSGETSYVWGFTGTSGTDYSIISGGTTGSNTVTLRWFSSGSKTVTINYTDANSCTAASATSSTSSTIQMPPTITSVSPLVGNTGTSVTISGTGFNTTSANDIVYFGATMANVSSASSTSLGVTVPTGADFSGVMVNNTACNLSATSNQYFLPDYNNSAYVAGTVNTDAQVTFASGATPYDIAIGDIDGDGKADIIVSNQGAGTISVYRSTSSSGSITSGSFAAAATFTASVNPEGIAVGDIDGDGKLDVIVTNNGSSTFSVFRNTSTSGSVSFASQVQVTTAGSPLTVAIGDIDGDGRPDVAIGASSGNNAYIFKNTSSTGSISFASSVSIGCTNTSDYVAIGDVDMDGKPDLLVELAGPSIEIFRNQSTVGTISSGSFSSGTALALPGSGGRTNITLADIDGDGKTDIVTSMYISGVVEVFHNTSTGAGSVSFAAYSPFTAASTPIAARVGDIDGDGMPDIVAAGSGASKVSVLRNTSTSGSISFANHVDFSVGSSPKYLAVGDLDGDGLADIVAANSSSGTLSVLRNDPLHPITGTTTICAGSTTTLSDATTGGTWASSNTSIATVNSSGVVSGVAGGTVLISYIGTAGSSFAGNITTVNVTVNAAPNISNFTSPSATSPCLGASSTVTVNSTSLGAGTFTVTYNLSGANTVTGHTATLTMGASSGTFTIPSADLGSTGSTTVTITQITNTSACNTTVSSSNTATFNVNVHPNVTGLTVSGNTVCATNLSNITIASSLTNGTYSFQFDLGAPNAGTYTATGVSVTGGAGSFFSPNLNNAGTTSVIVNTVTNGATGCSSASGATNNITVNPNPDISNFTSPTATTVCVGAASTVTVNSTTLGAGTFTVTYDLSGSNTVTGHTATLTMGATNGTFTIPSADLVGTGSTTVTITQISNSFTCNTTVSSSNTATFTVNALPAVSSSGVAVCAGNSGSLSASGASTYSWTPPTFLSATTGASVTVTTPTVTITYTVTGTDVNGCVNAATPTVTVNPLPNVYAITGGGSYCSGGVGSTIGLSGSDAGINYQLYRSAVTVGSAVSGTGSAISFAPATLSSTAYHAVATDATTGCTNNMSGTASVSILTSPAIVSMTGGGAVCGGGPGVPVGLSGSASGGSVLYQLYIGGGTPVGSAVSGVGSAFNFGTFTTLGTYTATATSTVNGCVANMSGTAVVTAAAGITIYTVLGGGHYCSGGTGVTVGQSGSQSGISYQLFNGTTAMGSPVIGTGSSISFGLQTVAGTYTVVGTNTSTGCFGNMSGSATVTIDPLPTIYTMTGGGSYCSGGTGVAVGLGLSQTGVDYQLLQGVTPTGSPVAGTGSAITFGLQTTAGAYFVVATDATTSCTNNMSGSDTVSINPLPTVTAGGAATICAGSPTGLSSGGAASYSWSPATALSASTGSAVTASPTTTTTYTVTGTDVNGCANTATVLVSVNPLPAVSGGSDVAICNGSSTGLTASGAVTYTWAPPATLFATTGTSVTASPTSNTTYTVTGTDANGCVNTAAVTVSVNPLPTVSAGSNVGICSGGSTGLTATGAVAYTWSPSATLSASTGASVTATPGATTAYTVTGTDVNGCVNTASVTVSVNAIPTVSGGSDVAICTGSSTVLTASGATTYSWSPSTGLSATTGTSVTASPTSITTYTVTGSLSGCNNTATVIVSVNALPTVTAGSPVTICSGTSAPLTAGGASTYVWTPSASLSATTGSSVSATPSSTTTYTVTGTDANGCSNTATVQVSVNPLPTVTSSPGSVICASTPTGLTASGAVSYTWSPSASLSASTGASVTATPTVTTTYTVTGTSAVSCSNTATVTLTVNPLPNNYAISGGGSFCSGTSGVAVGLAGSDAGINYQLYRTTSGGTAAVGSAVAGTGSPISFGLQTVAGTYTVVATNTTTSCSVNISGSTTVTLYTSPAVISMTGGGSYCTGGTGVAVGLAASAVGVNYQLYLGGSPVGSPVAGVGSALSFGLQSTAGTYTAVATNATSGCTTNMSGSAVVSVYAALTTYSVTGGGSYCAGGTGVTVSLSGSDAGVNYQLYRGGSPLVGTTISGTGGALSFGLQTTAGTYTVVATSASNGCTANMSGSAAVSINAAPAIYTMTGGGGYCTGGSGVAVGLSNSDVGINYQLYRGGSAVGSAVAGTGSALNFGLQTTAGTYTAVATDATTSCASNMSGSTSIAVSGLPTAYTVGGGGSYCSGGSGVHVTLSGSNAGINYQLYLGASPVGSPMAGTGGGLDFGPQTSAGTYTVTASNATSGCSNNMTGSVAIVVNALPAVYSVTGGGSYCSGGAGVAVGLSNSDAGINYQLYRGSSVVGSAVAGTGVALSYGNQTTAGTYTVVATNATTGCTSNMTGSATVSVNSLPVPLSVTGGGSYCTGGTGVHVGLVGSVTGTNYQLYLGASTVGSPMAGTGTSLDFGPQTTAGTYTVVATNTTTGCANNMSGSATITVNSLPAAYSVTGGGSYCSGSTGLSVGLSNSQSGVNYQLYLGGSPLGSAVSGTGIAISFGVQTTAGTYTVVATNASTSCTANMTGSATITINALPTVYTVTGGGAYCSGGSGAAVGLSSSDLGVNYQLYNGATTVGSPVAGTGSAISFGTFTLATTYTVTATNATTGCARAMSGSATVSISPLPAAVSMTGGGVTCASGPGVAVGLAASQVGVNYQLYNGASTVGSPVAGVGSSLSFGLQTTPGTYTAIATSTSTGCTNNMSGSAVVTNYPALTSFSVTGGGSYCSGGSGVAVGLGGSSSGVNYQLYRGATAVGSAVAGTGSAISFGLQTIAGTYTVVGTNASTSCTGNMTGSASVTIDALPTAYSVTGGGGYCSGGTGVTVGLGNSDVAVNYQLYNGASTVGSPVAGTGAAISFGLQTTSGTYTVVATNTTTSCTNTMTGSAAVTINALPAVFNVTGGGSYCSGPGVHIFLSGSATGVNYQLFNGASPVGSPIAGTGSTLDFGAFSSLGTYTAVATNATTGCTSNMSSSASVTGASLPVVYSVTGGGSYCSGGTGVHVGLSNSDAGINYQLYNGASTVGSPLAGTGVALDFGLETAAGTYTVMGINAGSSCTSTMSGSAVVSINSLPAIYAVTGGGNYCPGGTGVHVGLSSSASGVNYQLYLGASTVGSPMAGTGVALDFGLQTSAGTYTVVATDGSTSCTSNMSGSATVGLYSLPVAYSVTGGGAYCSGGSGVTIGLGGSQSGVSYQLFNGASPSGSAVAGTGSAISFGLHSATGTYSVVATNTTTTCTSNMTGSASVSVNPLPNDYAFTGGSSYCSGGSGVTIGLTGSDAGVNYQLYRTTSSGTVTVGSVVAGTGSAISMGTQTIAGTYTVVATNATTGCTFTLSGSTALVVNSLPAVVSVTGGGSYCSGGSGVAVGLAASAVGINYQLYLGGSPVGSPVAGVGGTLSFGLQTATGTYAVVATNATTGCTANMSGSATVSIYPALTSYSMTGGGSYCSGGSGVMVGLSGSSTGVNYQLYRGGSPLVGVVVSGTGAAISFGLQTVAGTYTAVATNIATSCTANMSGTSTVSINALPNAYTVTGGGGYCTGGSGVSIGLGSSDIGVNYQLYRGATAIGSPVAGTGVAISFGLQTVAGTYTVTAIDGTTGCSGSMTGSASVSINSLPTAYVVGGGGTFCAGGTGPHVTLSGSTGTTTYQLYVGGSPVGSPVSGTGGSLDFGPQSTVGTYTATATSTITGCTSNMTGSAVVSTYASLTAFSVTGGGGYCSGGTGLAVNLSGSSTGVNYQLFRGATAIGAAIAGTGSSLNFGLQTIAGTYTVVGTNTTTTCTGNMTGSATVSINPLPTAYSVTGGGGYCSGGAGAAVGLSNSDAGVNYQLYVGSSAVGSPVAGTGAAISFGAQGTAGTYTVVATNATTSCVNNMTGSVSVSVNPLPSAYNVTGGGAYCSGAGPHVYVSNSDVGVNYQLLVGGTPTGSPVAGTGATLDMGAQSTLGTYTVVATNATTGCTNNMTGSAAVTGFALPTIYNVTGGGSYCSGGTGVSVGLSNSDYGVSYQLYNGGSPVGSAVAGTNAALNFGLQTAGGTYTVVGTNTLACVNTMNGSATITVSSLPNAYAVTGGGSYCSGGAGVHVGLANSDAGVNYQLYRGATSVGSAVAGTGVALDFGPQTTAGTYTVVATDGSTSCTNNMTGSVSVSIDPLPTVFTVTGGGVFCAGGAGLGVGLSGSQSGISYQLFNGASATGSPVAGTGGAITFGLQTAAGTYTVVATNGSTTCTSNMTGSASITVNPLPNDYAFTGGNTYCSGGSGVTIGLAGSDVGVNYQLYRYTTSLGTVTVGSTVAGTGSAISFPTQTLAGLYTVIATNTTTGCTYQLSGSTNLSISPIPAIMTIGGGGSYCAGGSGVAVTLPGSVVGATYQLYRGGVAVGSPVSGTGSGLSFGLQSVTGSYTATGTYTATGCTSTMSGSVSVSIYPALNSYSMTGGGGYCTSGTGVTVGLSGSDAGVNYQLYLGGSPLVGITRSGTGAALSFGLQTSAGSYTVVATNTSTGCTANMSGSATVSTSGLPTAYSVTGGGSYCTGGTGVSVGLSNSDLGINYQLYRGGTAVGSAVAGSGSAISFGLQATAGTYTVGATNATTSCTSSMTGSAAVSINSLPTVYTVSGGGSYCTAPGPHVLLSGSNYGNTYQLYVGGVATGSPMSGTGGGLDFGAQTTAGTYTVAATNTSTSCTSNMSGSAVVTNVSAPAAYAVTGGGGYCSGGTGVHVGLAGSSTGVSYQLYLGGSAVGSALSGSGAALDFGLKTTAGTYTVVGTLVGYTCATNMTGSAIVSVNVLPSALSVTGGGSYCSGGSGVSVGLVGSVAGTNYQLYLGASAVGSAVAGTGTALSFGLQTTAGTYTVVATNATTGCTSTMSGSTAVSINALPGIFTVSGGGSYCSGGSGVTITLSGSQSGVSYQLYNGASPAGSALSGTGSALSFGTISSVGTYTVTATNTSTGCSSNMAGSAAVAVNALPSVFTVTGGGSYCTGGTGVHIGLSSSTVGINYRLYSGTTAVGSAVAGTGAALDFGLFTAAGTYTAKATDATTGCSANMSGSASISINPLPAIASMTGGGSFCTGGSGVHVGLSASVVGINYQLYLAGSPVGSPVAGTAGSLDFGLQTTAGIYTAVATNATTGCVSNMSGSATVAVNPLPTVYSVTGGGSYCSGGTGVNVGISGSNTGITYKLFVSGSLCSGGIMSGTGAAFNFGLQTIAGTYTITATNGATGCAAGMSGSVTVSVTPLPTAGTISGGTSLHNGATITLTSTSSGGTWSSSAPSVATVGSSSGIVTGVSLGYTNIAYVVSNACGSSTAIVTIHDLGPTPPPQAGYTTGNTSICVGSTTQLTNSAAGGTWTSSNSDIATIDPQTGYVRGLTTGIAAITYTVETQKGEEQVLTPIVVNAVPDALAITSKTGTLIASGRQITLTAAVGNSASVKSYQWLINNHAVKGANAAIFTASDLANNDEVRCVATGDCGTVSASVAVTVTNDQVAHVQLTAADIRVIPNPNNGTFMIRGAVGGTADQELLITVTDVLGQVIYNDRVIARDGIIDQSVQLSAATPNGMYLLTVRTGSESKVFHIVVEQ